MKKMHFVEKADNPANLPECRPIKNFWSILKGLVYKDNWYVDNLLRLRSRIKYFLNNVDIELIRSLAQSIPGLVDKVRMNGLIENYSILIIYIKIRIKILSKISFFFALPYSLKYICL